MSDLPLTTRSWGNGTRRALLVHGITSDSGGWWRVGPAVADLGYEVVAADLRGHGQSPHASSYRLEDYAGDLLALGTDWELVIGHSLGGATVLAAAGARSTFALRLALVDPWLVNDGLPPPDREEYGAVETATEIAAKNPNWEAEDVSAKAAALPAVDRELIDQTFAQKWNLIPVLDDVTVTTLLLAADPQLGSLTTQAVGERAAATNALVRFETIYGGGHSMHRDAWDDFWGVLSDFTGG